jgi:hypothetical protein
MNTNKSFPQIVLMAAVRDFKNLLFRMTWTKQNTVMVWTNKVTLYYVLNNAHDVILDVQVD